MHALNTDIWCINNIRQTPESRGYVIAPRLAYFDSHESWRVSCEVTVHCSLPPGTCRVFYYGRAILRVRCIWLIEAEWSIYVHKHIRIHTHNTYIHTYIHTHTYIYTHIYNHHNDRIALKFDKHIGNPYIEGILPKGPYPPCLRMADRALLAGYPRHVRHDCPSSTTAIELCNSLWRPVTSQSTNDILPRPVRCP